MNIIQRIIAVFCPNVRPKIKLARGVYKTGSAGHWEGDTYVYDIYEDLGQGIKRQVPSVYTCIPEDDIGDSNGQ